MTTATKTKATLEEYARAVEILDNMKSHFRNGGLLLVSMQLGSGMTDYLRPFTVTKRYESETVSNLTWAMAKVFDYRLKDRNGRYYLALGGGNYSKPDELARALANYCGLDYLHYETI